MANDTTVKKEEKKPFVPQFKPITVKRNDVELTFNPAQVKKGDYKDQEYLAPEEVKIEDGNRFVAWVGLDNLLKKATGMVKTLSQGWWFEAIEQATDEATGKVDENKAYEVFTQFASEFSASGESIPELKSQIQDLVDQMSEIDPTQDGAMEKIVAFAGQIKKLNVTVNGKKRLTKEERLAKQAEEKAA